MTKRANRIVGDVPCPSCGEPSKARISARNHLYVVCPHEGGCGLQHFCRSDKSDRLLARRISKWVDPNERRAFLGEEAKSSKETARPPAKKDSPAPAQPKTVPWWDREL